MSLAEIQKVFWELLQGAEGPLDAFVGSADLPAAERVGIYAEMFLHRQVDALRETFPKVVVALGDEAFFATAEKYLRAHPSEHPDLGQLGRRFADFLERGDLRDLARLEWARAAVFEAPPATSMSLEGFAALAQDPVAFMHHRVRFIPALRLLALENDIAPLWDETAPAGTQGPAHWVVWRSGFDVFHVRLEEDEARAAQLALGGAQVGEICGALEDPMRATAALQSWLGEGWLSVEDSEAGSGAES